MALLKNVKRISDQLQLRRLLEEHEQRVSEGLEDGPPVGGIASARSVCFLNRCGLTSFSFPRSSTAAQKWNVDNVSDRPSFHKIISVEEETVNTLVAIRGGMESTKSDVAVSVLFARL